MGRLLGGFLGRSEAVSGVGSTSASASSSAGWRTLSPPPAGASRSRGSRTTTTTRRSASRSRGADRRDLAVADRPPTARARSTLYAPPAPQHSPSSSVSTRRYAGASTVRTAPCACCTWRRWHGSCTTTVAPVSRSGERGLLRHPLREVAHPRRERVRVGCAEQPAVVLHRRAAARRCRRRRVRRPASTR